MQCAHIRTETRDLVAEISEVRCEDRREDLRCVHGQLLGGSILGRRRRTPEDGARGESRPSDELIRREPTPTFELQAAERQDTVAASDHDLLVRADDRPRCGALAHTE
jgi:hypothetical protein